MRRLLAIAAGAALLASACADDPTPPGAGGGPDRRRDLDGRVVLAAATLEPFDECEALLDHLKREARERVGPYGLDGGGPVIAMEQFATGADDAARSAPAPEAMAQEAEATAAAGGDVATSSQTNVQEQGVDEPDIVKTDGRLLLSVAGGRLHVADVSGPEPVLRGSLALPGAAGGDGTLLLHGDRALVLSNGWGQARPLAASSPAESELASFDPGNPNATITEVDLSDPSAPRAVSTLEVEGQQLSARMVDGAVRLVVRSEPELGFVYPQGGGPEAEARAEEVNRRVVDESTLDQWLPSASLDGGDERTVVDCRQVHAPAEFAGFGTLSVLTLDLGAGLRGDPVTGEPAVGVAAVLAAGETVYASAESLYVATTAWVEPVDQGVDQGGDRVLPAPAPAPSDTDLHRFATPADGPVAYVASGRVRGQLLNQFSMSEHEGHLRVATTVGQTWGGEAEPSESFVTTLTERDGALVQVGQVGGLGKGERIYAVRFLGDVGYVVTFRQVDPLYTVDLRDPAAPRVTGELKIEGYSAYLHPVGDGLLLGVGRDATLEGRTTGTQVSLFDVSDPAAPARLQHHAVADARSEAEYDHHAFLWWPAERLAVLPLSTWSPDADAPRSGALGLTVDAGGIDERGWVAHPTVDAGGWPAEIRRSVVVGERLYTVSDAGITATDLPSFGEVVHLPLR